MHEMSLALSIIEQTRAAAVREGGGRVIEVELDVGSLAGVMVDSLRFCLEAVGPSSGLAGTAFRINEVAGEGACRGCGAAFRVLAFPANCPECRGEDISISGGQDLKIRALTIED